MVPASQLTSFINLVYYNFAILRFVADDIRAPPAFLSFDLTYNDKHFCAGTKKHHDEALLYFWYDNLLCCFIFSLVLFICVYYMYYIFYMQYFFPIE